MKEALGEGCIPGMSCQVMVQYQLTYSIKGCGFTSSVRSLLAAMACAMGVIVKVCARVPTL